jgi:hypothetical protein
VSAHTNEYFNINQNLLYDRPSAQLFSHFDTLLLLAKEGRTVYFGDIGDNADIVRKYFRRHDAPCPPSVNPAEHMIDVVTGTHSSGKDWHQIWLESPEAARMKQDLDNMIIDASNKEPNTIDDGHEFATSLWTQSMIVTNRMNVSLYRNIDYVSNLKS